LAAVDPLWQDGRATDERVQLGQQALCNLEGPLVAGCMKGYADLVRQPSAARSGVHAKQRWWLPYRQPWRFDSHRQQSGERYYRGKIRVLLLIHNGSQISVKPNRQLAKDRGLPRNQDFRNNASPDLG
jgi:hypothetical protein